MPRLVSRRIALFALLLLASPAAAQDISGSWRGRWNDTNTGHQGPLRASITCCDGQHYHAVFTGRFFAVVPFRFSTTLNVVGQDGDHVLLGGQSRLPLFGNFTYSGTATNCSLIVDFCSARYTGRFNLCRN